MTLRLPNDSLVPSLPTADIQVGTPGTAGWLDTTFDDVRDLHNARHLGNTIRIHTAAAVASLHVANTAFQATVRVAESMETTLLRYSPESRTRQIAEALFEPLLQAAAETSVAVAQDTNRAIRKILGR